MADASPPLRALKGDGSNLQKESTGKTTPMAAMFKVAAAAAKFKRGAIGPHAVSREKRELFKKVETDKTFMASSQRIVSQLQELVKPHLVEDPAPDDKSDAGSSDSEPGGQAAILNKIQDICKGFCTESIQICCDTWEADKHAKSLKTAKDHLAATEKSNRDAQHNFMMELSNLKTQLQRAQQMVVHDVKVTRDDIIFYEATEYLSEEQRELVKEVVEYKLRDELARGNPLPDLGEKTEELKKQTKEQEEEINRLQEQVRDEQAALRNLRAEFDERARADLEKVKVKPIRETPKPETPPVVPKKDNAAQTDPIKAEVVVQAEERPATTDAATDPMPRTELIRELIRCRELIASDVQTDPMKEVRTESKMSIVYKDAPKPDVAVAETQTDVQENPHQARIEELSLAADEKDRLCEERTKEIEQQSRQIIDMKAELASLKRSLAEAAKKGGAVQIVEVVKEAPPKPSALKETQTDPMEKYTGPSEEEQALALKLKEDKIRQLQDAAAKKDQEIKLLTTEQRVMQTKLGDLQEAYDKKPGEVVQVPSNEGLQKAEAAARKLEKNNKILADELEQSKEHNTKLEIAINELREKLQCLQEQLRNAGMGHIADRMFDSAGLAEILSNKPMSVFDRLYNDALKRERRQHGYQDMKKQAAKAFMDTIGHIDNHEPPLQRSSSPIRVRETQERVSVTTLGGTLTRASTSGGLSSPHEQEKPQKYRYFDAVNNPAGITSPTNSTSEPHRRSLVQTPPSTQSAPLDGTSSPAANEVDLKVGIRVRATEGIQTRIGARMVQVPKGSLGTLMQLYPQLGVDWDCVPSVDKMFVQRDMIEAATATRPAERQGVASEPLRHQADPPHRTSVNDVLPMVNPGPSMSMRLPHVPPSSSATEFFPPPGSRLPQVGSQGLIKSASTPTFVIDNTTSPVRRLPRLDSPGPMKIRTTSSGRMASSAGFETKSAGFDSTSFVVGAGTRPMTVSMGSNSVSMEQRRGAGGKGGPDELTNSKSMGNLRSGPVSSVAALQQRSRSTPPPKFMVSGEMCVSSNTVAMH